MASASGIELCRKPSVCVTTSTRAGVLFGVMARQDYRASQSRSNNTMSVRLSSAIVHVRLLPTSISSYYQGDEHAVRGVRQARLASGKRLQPRPTAEENTDGLRGRAC